MRRLSVSFAAVLAALVIGGPAAPARAQTGEISLGRVALNVADIARAERFYTEVFGLVRTFQFPPDGDDPIEIGLGRPDQRAGMGLLLAHFNDDPLPAGRTAYGRIVIMTDDARGLADRAVARGAKMLRDSSAPNGPIILFLSDVDGYEFELYQAPAGQ